ncbi:hypothetical protein LTR62_002088 [Meristemomyces frigidus]|uniref:Peroxin 20 n=1 Tax=Meristemomyces frigidus TaxID=1508187 RepID=A0AAN7TFZ0_9PEZI|nr:hypothetical protein LTR62_002088 [Meristemomyces frigidus]
MADALCGPSNPLQQFKQQSSLDRTLQQDRLTSRASPVQGFRSPNPNAGLLDPEFAAFQAGLPVADLETFHPHSFQQPQGFGGNNTPSWATDFQQMHISPAPSQQILQNPNHVAPSALGWAQGFRQQHVPSPARAQQISPQTFQQRARYGFQPSFSPSPMYQAPALESKGKEPAYRDFDEAAFEQAFEQAKSDMMAEQSAEQAVEDTTDMASVIQEQDDLLHSLGAEQSRMNLNDVMQRPVEQEIQETHMQHEEDALAATAQELLEKVSNDHSDKFQNSQFLNLMRKLRDREVKVEGDKMVETVSNTPHTPTVAHTFGKHLHLPSQSSPHDSSYASGSSTPASMMSTNDSWHFDTHALTDASLTNAPSTTATATAAPLPEQYFFNNSEQRPSPLAAWDQPGHAVDTRSLDPRIEHADGQEVVELLKRPENWADDIGTSTSSIPPAAQDTRSSWKGGAPFYGDLRAMHGARSEESAGLSEMLYGEHGTIGSPAGITWSP